LTKNRFMKEMRGGQGYEKDNEKRKNGQENFEGLG
jgi:hypothetical protein